MTSPARRLGPLTALAAALLLFLAAPASAHTALTGSDPEDGARIAAPDQVTLTFNEAIRSARVVIRAEGTQTEAQKGAARVEEGKVLQQVKAGLPDGKYTIGYRVISADGHPVTGLLSFTVTGPSGGQTATDPAQDSAAPSAAPSSAAASEPEENGTARWLMVGAGLAAGAGIGLLFTMRRRKDA